MRINQIFCLIVLTFGLGACGGNDAAVSEAKSSSPEPIRDQLLCDPRITEEIAKIGIQVWQVQKSVGQFDRATNNMASALNLVTSPRRPATTRSYKTDGMVRFASWNVHHGVGEFVDGICYQQPYMYAIIKRLQADVVILQEVNSWDYQEYAHRTGMVGFFEYTHPAAGNLILVHPDHVVMAQKQKIINYEIAGNRALSKAVVLQWLANRNKPEPRGAQVVRLKLGNRKNLAVWNTHLPTGTGCDSACRTNVARNLVTYVTALAPTVSVGGGDMNAVANSSVINIVQSFGFIGDPRGGIDWIFGRSLAKPPLSVHEIVDHRGRMISDHPLIFSQFRY